jgi:hypothetical protein
MSFPVVFHTENCAVHSRNPTVSSVYLLTPSSVCTQPSKMNKRGATVVSSEVCRSLAELRDTESRHYSNRVKTAAIYDSVIEKLNVLEPDASRETFSQKIFCIFLCIALYLPGGILCSVCPVTVQTVIKMVKIGFSCNL